MAWVNLRVQVLEAFAEVAQTEAQRAAGDRWASGVRAREYARKRELREEHDFEVRLARARERMRLAKTRWEELALPENVARAKALPSMFYVGRAGA